LLKIAYQKSKQLFSDHRIVSLNIAAVVALTVIVNLTALAVRNPKGVGFLYFEVICLLINILTLLILSLVSFILKANERARDFLRSVVYSVIIFSSLQMLFFLL
jgi:hypothetical protein